MSILAEERKKVIIEELNLYGKVKVLSLAERLEVSSETIRRDLDALEQIGRLKRVYGGAVKQNYAEGEPPYYQRQDINLAAKRAIGQRAAELLSDGDTVVIDTGTTMLEFARAIQGRKRLTVLTNSLPVASLLAESLNQQLFTGKVVLLGGEINTEQQSISGPLCEKMLETFHVDKAFISVGGISLSTGISDYDINESMMSIVMARVSKAVFVLADQSKIGVQAFCKITSLDAVDVIISDHEKPASWENELESKGVTWMAVEIGEGRA
ncbi:DeoR/GlpR family DNA-binding transcription regulator [Brevibacillus choshinensis]|uniref:DeoR/GlpR family DNA-binding transcription regulator n=1 Tax=Brevibacillus choshinensis TaxID=54911 RepID=UPI002E24AB8A|nr:DeoR/GlpR family DNA-binding transcription regulator [Brevibacillus choshinensis]